MGGRARARRLPVGSWETGHPSHRDSALYHKESSGADAFPPQPEDLVRHHAWLIAAFSCAASVPLAAQQPPTPRRVVATPSTLASVEVHINARRGRTDHAWWFAEAGLAGPSRVAITYGQPHARGRKIENGLIPLDTVWRFGANMATSLHTDVAMTIGALRVPHGDYTLFLLHTGKGWELIVNSETSQWGWTTRPPRMSTEDALSIYLVPDAVDPTTETADLRGILRIKWGRTELTAPWAVDEQ